MKLRYQMPSHLDFASSGMTNEKDKTMKFFVDTADVNEIRELEATGLLDGVTTNPSLIKKSGRDFKDVIKEICAVTSGPVSAEVVARVTAEGFGLLDAPPQRLNAKDTPVPYHPDLWTAHRPTASAMASATRRLLEM